MTRFLQNPPRYIAAPVGGCFHSSLCSTEMAERSFSGSDSDTKKPGLCFNWPFRFRRTSRLWPSCGSINVRLLVRRILSIRIDSSSVAYNTATGIGPGRDIQQAVTVLRTVFELRLAQRLANRYSYRASSSAGVVIRVPPNNPARRFRSA